MKPKLIIFLIAILATVAIAIVFLRQPAQAAITRVINSVRVTNGLVGYWSFDGPTINWGTGKVTDVSNTGNTGQLIAMSTSTSPVAGIAGQGLKFDGSNSYLLLGDIDATEGIQGLTVSAWIYRTKENAYQGIVGKYSSDNNWLLYISGNTVGKENKPNFLIDANVTNHTDDVANTGKIILNTWHHIVGVYNGAQVMIYQDGVLRRSVANTGNIDVNTDTVQIGRYSASNYFNGSIDELRVYNRALSAGEIQYLYRKNAREFGNKISVSGLASTTINAPQTNKFTNGLVGYWSFDGPSINWGTGQVTDLSGSSNTGQLISMSTSTSPVAGIAGQGLKFDGSNSYLLLGDIDATEGIQGLTVSAWIYRTKENAYQGIVGKYSSDNNWLLYISGNTVGKENKPNFLIDANVTNHTDDVANTGKIILNTWHHIVGVYNGAQVMIYQDGVLRRSVANTGNIDVNTDTVQIGRYSASNYFNGSIDELRVYNRALSAGEIQYLYRKNAREFGNKISVSGLASTTINAPQTNKFTNGLVGYWSFDGPSINWGTGQVTDLSGSSNTGQLISMSTSTSPVAGIVGQGLKFNGVDGFVNIPSFTIPTTGSVTFWWKPEESPTASDHPLFTNRNGATSDFFDIYPFSDGNLYAGWFRTSNDDRVAWAISGIARGEWHQVTLTWANGGNTILYIDGANKASTASLNATFDTSGVPTRIANTDGSVFPKATIDEVRVYNRALSAAEIYEMYRSSKR